MSTPTSGLDSELAASEALSRPSHASIPAPKASLAYARSDKSFRPFVESALFALVATFAFLGLRVDSGLWEPWEIDIADAAARSDQGIEFDSIAQSPLAFSLLRASYRLFGRSELTSHVPALLCAALTLLLIALWSRSLLGRKGALYAGVITLSSPLFVLNARSLIGDTLAFATQTALAWVAYALFARRPGVAVSWSARRFFLVAAFASLLGLALLDRGALLIALPPLASLAWVRAYEGRRFTQGRWPALLLALVVLSLALPTLAAIVADRGQYNFWIGGLARGGEPPAFDKLFESVFHAFAPWSALLLFAIPWACWAESGEGSNEEESTAGLAGENSWVLHWFVLWLALAFVAHSLFAARYGEVPFLSLFPAVMLSSAFLIHSTERKGALSGLKAAGVFLLIGLQIRDFALYPASPLRALAMELPQLPTAFHPKVAWLVLLGALAFTLVYALGHFRESAALLPLRASSRWFAMQWSKGTPYRLWLVALTSLLCALLVFSLLCWTMPGLRLSTLARRVGRGLGFLPLAIAVGALGLRLASRFYARLGRYRLVPALAIALAFSLYLSQGYHRGLSAQLSLKSLFESYTKWGGRKGRDLGEYRTRAAGARYYVGAEPKSFDNLDRALDFIAHPSERRWLMFPAEELAELDRRFRHRQHRHLFLPPSENAKVLLATNRGLTSTTNANPLAASVLRQPPQVQFPLRAQLDDKLELLGYRLSLPHGDYVGAGERFVVYWVFRCLRSNLGDWKIFLHVDGKGLRINGDHEAVEGHYPIRYWEAGDVIVDRQEILVPGNFRPGDYGLWLGVFQGDTRMNVVAGPQDGENRIQAGVLHVR